MALRALPGPLGESRTALGASVYAFLLGHIALNILCLHRAILAIWEGMIHSRQISHCVRQRTAAHKDWHEAASQSQGSDAMTSESPSPPPCRACTERPALPFEFSMAFQPIVDVRNRSLFACEALVRGTDGSGAAAILAQVTDENRYQFDQACRVKAVELAACNCPATSASIFCPTRSTSRRHVSAPPWRPPSVTTFRQSACCLK